MSRAPLPPIFLQRASYRQRRLRDGVKLVPFLGVILWTIPLAWPTGGDEGDIGAQSLIYIFGVWVVLIALTAILSSRIRSDAPSAAEDAADT